MKEYLVTLHNIEDLQSFYEDMETPGGSLYIPDRVVELVARREISRTTHYMLSDEEADLVRQDSRVLSVQLNDEDRGVKRMPLGGFDSNLRQISNNWDLSNTVSANMLNWGLVRCTRPRPSQSTEFDAWGYLSARSQFANAEIGFKYLVINNRTISIKSDVGDTWTNQGSWDPTYASWGDYFNTGVWPTSSNATVDLNFYGANVDVVIVDGGNVPFEHPEFAVNPDGSGGSRCVAYNWYQHNPAVKGTSAGSYTYGSGYNSHAIHVTSTVAGITQGWARKSSIYNISYNEGAYVVDYIREFHKNKPINPATGLKNPTIVNNSWGNFSGTFTKDKITGVSYRGNTYSAPFTDQKLFDYGLLPSANYYAIGASDSALEQDIIDAVNEGIIFVAAAGNSKYLIDRPDGPDWNNSVTLTANTSHAGHAAAGTYFYNRGQIPGTINKNYKLTIGALSSLPWDAKADFSNCGFGIDFYAPGYSIMGAYLNETNINPAVQDSRNSSYYLQKVQGTSMATPQVTGIIACLAERYPHWSQANIKEYLLQTCEYNTIKDGVRAWDSANSVATFGSDYNIQGSGNRVVRFNVRGLQYEGNISLSDIKTEFIDDGTAFNKKITNYIDRETGLYGPFAGSSVSYSSPGTYNWTCPANIYNVSIVMVGAGGSGGTKSSSTNSFGGGGGGGGLGYVNSVSVTPGNIYPIVVGAGGAVRSGFGLSGFAGGSTTITINGVVYAATGGSGGLSGDVLNSDPGNPSGGAGGAYNSNCTTGGVGGIGGTGVISLTGRSGGGGGAGGYSGNGGAGGYYESATVFYSAENGIGGAGGGGGYAANNSIGGNGGGVVLYGESTNGIGGGVGIIGSNGSSYSTFFAAGGGGAGGISTSGAGQNGAIRILWPGNFRTFPVSQVQDVSSIHPPRKFSDFYSADYKVRKPFNANLIAGGGWNITYSGYTPFTSNVLFANNTKKIEITSNTIIGSSTTGANVFSISGGWRGDLIIINNGSIIGAGGDNPSEIISTKSGGHALGISKSNVDSNIKIINYGFIAGGGGGGGTGGQGGEGEWQYTTYSNTQTANSIIRWRGYRKDNGADYPGYDVWPYNSTYTKSTGTLVRYTPTSNSLEIQQAQNSGYYTTYSFGQDHWYYDELQPNLRVRIAAIDAGGNSRYRPYYAGQLLYFHYVGPENTELAVTIDNTFPSDGFAGTLYNLSALDRPILTSTVRSHIATTWGTNSTVNQTTPSEDGKIFTVTVSSGTGIGTDADPYKDFHYTRVSTTSSWRTTGYSHRPGTAHWPKNMWTGKTTSLQGGYDPKDGVSNTLFGQKVATGAAQTRTINNSNTSSLCIYNVPATVGGTSYQGVVTLDLFYYPTYNIYGSLGHPWYYLHYNDTNGYDGGLLFISSSGGLTFGGGFSTGFTTAVRTSIPSINYRKTARRAGGAGGSGQGFTQSRTNGVAGSAQFENAGQGGTGGNGGEYGEDGVTGFVGYVGYIANANIVGANIEPLLGNIGGYGGNAIYGTVDFIANYGNIYGRYNDNRLDDGLGRPTGDGNVRPRYRAGT